MSHNAPSSLTTFCAAVSASLLTFGTAAGQSCPAPAEIIGDLDGTMAHVRYLADDRLEGRAVGSAGARCAADYIAGHFADMGLEPAGTEGNYFQPFPIRKGAELSGENALVVDGRTLRLGTDWSPLGYSGSASVEGSLVFGGYGLSSPGNPADRDARLDIEGRIVVLEWGDPDSPNGRSLRSDPHFKSTVSAGRDAAAAIIMLPEGMALPDLTTEDRNALGMPALVVTAEHGRTLREAAERGARASITTNVSPVMVDANNVVGMLRGSNPALVDEYVIIGAHYDHLGMGGEGSLDPDRRDVHNGADDNASGTAAVIESARQLAAGPPPERSIVFMAFTGEERGLWGSEYFAAQPTIDLGATVAMMNLDMVGRVTDDRVTIYGFASAAEWDAIVDEANASLVRPLNIGKAPDAFGPSDHTSFAARDIPVLHFFSNTHADYHRPSDDWQKVNVDGMDRITLLTATIARRLATGETAAVTWVEQEEEAPAHGGASTSGSSTSAYGGVYLGSIPDMTPREYGLRLTGVREGSPAEQGGLRAGDVVVVFGGNEITDIYSYTYALQDKKPGDVVEIVVERDGERVTLEVTLGERN